MVKICDIEYPLKNEEEYKEYFRSLYKAVEMRYEEDVMEANYIKEQEELERQKKELERQKDEEKSLKKKIKDQENSLKK